MLNSGNSSTDGTSNEPLPWLRGPSIYSHIKDHLDPITGRLDRDGFPLPDDERQNVGFQFRWAPGALEGNLPNLEPETTPNVASQIASYVIIVARENSESAQLSLYELLAKTQVLSVIDSVIQEFTRFGVSPDPYLYNYAVSLAQNAPDRGPVKFAIALLGIIGHSSDKETISMLGRHDEFTLYTTVALLNLLDEPEPELWNLAQKVDGWGKIEIVRRLSTSTSPEIQHWLLRDGYRNNIMYEYLAYICAIGGNLKTALSAKIIDDELLNSAGEIISALVRGGPAQNLDDYQDAAYVVSRYLDHIETRATTLEHFDAAASIMRYLASDDWSDEELRSRRQSNGWTSEARTASLEKLKQILHAPRWIALVEKGLVSSDDYQFQLAGEAANVLHIDTWQNYWARLLANPLNTVLWYNVLERATSGNIEQIIDLATQSLPIDQIAIGPGDAIGLGPEYQIHSCLDFILQGLQKFPGNGWPLIAAGLKSPVVRNRNLALRTLASWGRDNWTADIYQALTEAQIVEPKDDVKARISRILRGFPLD